MFHECGMLVFPGNTTRIITGVVRAVKVRCLVSALRQSSPPTLVWIQADGKECLALVVEYDQAGAQLH